jgi:hypothetical protein
MAVSRRFIRRDELASSGSLIDCARECFAKTHQRVFSPPTGEPADGPNGVASRSLGRQRGLGARIDAGDVQLAGKAATAPDALDHGDTEVRVDRRARPVRAAWAVAAVSPNPASATPPESSAPTIIFLVFVCVLLWSGGPEWTAVLFSTPT